MKKIILITGASGGIGKETALALAKQGHKIIMHGRNPEKTKKAVHEVKNKSGNRDVSLIQADLSLMADVKQFSDEIHAKYDHLDVLINNAGGQFGDQREVTPEGHEKTFAINTLAPFLLTNLLLDLLKKSSSARIVTVSSESYKIGGRVDWDDVEFADNYSLTRSYGLTKRYVWWLMEELADRLKANGTTNVTVNTCEPGSAKTGLQRESSSVWYMKVIEALWTPLMTTPEKAASTSVYLASSPAVEGVTGKFFGKSKVKKIKPKWLKKSDEEKIWRYCAQACQQYFI